VQGKNEMGEIVNFKYDMSEVEDFVAQYPEASRDAAVAKITEALLFLESRVKPATPYGAGPIHLRDTIFFKLNTTGEPVSGLLGTPAIYGESVELGTKPHFPPIDPIQHWVEKKFGYEGKDARAVAYLIARKISKKGTKGAHMFGKTWDDNKSMVIRILEEIPEEILRRIK
jgi:hypothetical protein